MFVQKFFTCCASGSVVNYKINPDIPVFINGTKVTYGLKRNTIFSVFLPPRIGSGS